MTLRKKSALLALASIAGLLLTMAAVQRWALLHRAGELERQETQRQMLRVEMAVRNEIQHLDTLVHDWAAWDDMYRFVQDGNEQFRQSSLPDEALVANRTNLLMIVDVQGRIVFSRGLDLGSRAVIEVPELAPERLSASHPLVAHAAPDSSVGGVLLTAQGPMLIASRPILTSQEQGPVAGALLMGRLVDADMTQRLAAVVGETLALYRVDNPELPADVTQALAALSSSSPTYGRALDAQQVAGYALLPDIYGAAALVARIVEPRVVYQHSVESFRVLMVAMVVATLLVCVVALALWYGVVFSHAERLSLEVERMAQSVDLSHRLPAFGQDEIGVLAARINSMLSSLQRAEEGRAQSQRYLRAATQAAQLLLQAGREIPYEMLLKTLGEAVDASRVYVCLPTERQGQDALVSARAEWRANGPPDEASRPRFQNLDARADAFRRWLETLSQGQSIHGRVADLPAEERAVLEAEGVTSVLALPLKVDGAVQGFIGFDQREATHPWEAELVDLLRGVAADLSQTLERQEAEAELQELKEFNEGIVRSVGDGLVVEDADGIITFVNPATERLLGYTGAELLGRHWRLVVAPQEVARVLEQTQRRPEGVEGHYETRLLHKDGHEIPALANARPLFRDGAFAGVLTAFADIAARVQAEAETQAWKQRYDVTVASSGQIVYDYDTADGCIVWGGGTELVLGLTPQEMSGGLSQWEQMLHAEDRAQALDLLRQAERLRAPYDVQYRMRHKDGSYRWMHDRGIFVPSAEGRPAHMLGMLQDITARKRAEEERDKLEVQLREAQKIQSVGLLAGGVAHDFNNLLTVILGNTELALEQTEPCSPQRRELEAVHKTAKRAAGLTQQLLAFGRCQMLRPRLLDLNALVSDFGRMLGRLIGEHIQLQLELAPSLGEVYADASALTQVLMNLALNARDAMPAERGEGLLRIVTRAVSPDPAFYEAHPEARRGRYAQISVIDNGAGMDEATKQHLFEPFFTTKELGQGSGLGLAVVYGIVRQHNGWVEVQSQPGRGARVDVYLPLHTAAGQPDSHSRSRKVLGGQETILVAEDEQGVRELTQGLLQSLGYRVQAARDGREALEVFQANPHGFDLALLDAMMPRLSGIKAYESMCGIRQDLPVLFLSGYSPEMIGMPACGPRLRLLQKPFSRTELAQTVREMLAEA